MRIADGFEEACEVSCKHLEAVADKIEFSMDDPQPLIDTAMTTLSSKIINKHKREMAKIAVEAVMKVANFETRDVNFDLIKVEGKAGGTLEETEVGGCL